MIINLTNHVEDNSEKLLGNCVLNTIRNNFRTTPTIIINEKKTINEEFDKYFVTGDFPRIVSEDNFNTSSIYMQEGYILSITYIDDCETLSSLKDQTIEGPIKYLVIILNYSEARCIKTLQTVGHNTSMYDVTYIVKINNDYSILTYMPEINVTTCTLQYDSPPTILSTCSSNKRFNAFPSKKIQNYMGCPFKVGMASLFPFSTFTNKSELYIYKPLEEDEVHGSDVEILKIMADIFNFTLDMHFIFSAEKNPVVAVRYIDFLLNGSLDLCAGGLYRIYGDLVDYSGVYGRQAIIWMYAAKRDTRSWQGLVGKVNGLYLFVIFYFVYTIIWQLFCMFDKQSVSLGRMLIHTWGALIGTSSLVEGKTLKQKILNLMYLVMCIHLTAYVNIQMFSFLTIASPPTIYKTNTDILQSGLRPYLMMRMKYFMSDKSYEAFANTSADCESFSDCEEKTLKLNGVTVVIDGQFVALQAETAVNDEAITLSTHENLLTVYHEMLLRKDVPIIKSFQKMMVRLRESGISDRLYDEAIGILTKSKSENAAKNMMGHSYSCKTGCSITLAQSAGAFYVWMIGCGLSFCIFVIEGLGKRERN
ncbi:hypothetical protein ABMA28_004968 [Loxostege sticticalis]|uniref:Uncharacterized protein n=1 Tax=Loxostege sticticalis TaxID=481309 RepID=A0ABD0SRB0_LOXSC